MKTIPRLFIVLAFASLGVAADKAREDQENDIREAVFRYQFHHYNPPLQKTAGAYYLGVGEKITDPSDEFMKRFTDHKPPVRKISTVHYVPDKGIFDNKTEVQGLAFIIRSLKWISDTEVEVSGKCYEGPVSATGNIYTVKKENGKWKVTKDKMVWIS